VTCGGSQWRLGRGPILLAALAVVAAGGAAGASTSLTGSTGLLFVPEAEVVPSDHFAFGGVITDAHAFPARGFSWFADNNLPSSFFSGYLTIGYVPRLEITVRGNGMPGTAGPSEDVGPYYTDGMISAQLVAWRGGGRIPSVAVGLQDIYGFMIFNAAYAVCTWKVPLDGAGELSFTVGWAVDWYDRNVGTQDVEWEPNHVIDGPLAGLEYPVRRWLSTIVEYDSRSVNLGARIHPTTWVTLDVAAVRWGLDEMAAGRIKGFGAHLVFNGII